MRLGSVKYSGCSGRGGYCSDPWPRSSASPRQVHSSISFHVRASHTRSQPATLSVVPAIEFIGMPPPAAIQLPPGPQQQDRTGAPPLSCFTFPDPEARGSQTMRLSSSEPDAISIFSFSPGEEVSAMARHRTAYECPSNARSAPPLPPARWTSHSRTFQSLPPDTSRMPSPDTLARWQAFTKSVCRAAPSSCRPESEPDNTPAHSHRASSPRPHSLSDLSREPETRSGCPPSFSTAARQSTQSECPSSVASTFPRPFSCNAEGAPDSCVAGGRLQILTVLSRDPVARTPPQKVSGVPDRS
mmetsp:Transcript_5038/g.12091  ORF Transcript_5038/g.12091 Transcript_5038/m.12091 type:complete len:300 (-) Transcript_5038:103-1002(-)